MLYYNPHIFGIWYLGRISSLMYPKLGGGFKCFEFSLRSQGKWSDLITFSIGWFNHQQNENGKSPKGFRYQKCRYWYWTLECYFRVGFPDFLEMKMVAHMLGFVFAGDFICGLGSHGMNIGSSWPTVWEKILRTFFKHRTSKDVFPVEKWGG